MKNILEAPFMVETVRTLTNLYRLGWDERNGGNLSYRILPEELEGYVDTDAVIRTIPMSFDASEISGMVFLVTGTGKYFKNASALSFLRSPTLASIHDHWKNQSLD